MSFHGKAREVRAAALSNREIIKGDSFSADSYQFHGTGRMPSLEAAQYKFHQDAGSIAYTVMSYRTPILFVLTDGTIIRPDVKYSATTSQHQGFAATYVR